MSAPRSRATRLAAGLGAGALAVVLATGSSAPSSVASGVRSDDDKQVTGDVDVVNTETVKAYLDATGKIDSSHVYEQLVMTGDGHVDLVNPIETDGSATWTASTAWTSRTAPSTSRPTSTASSDAARSATTTASFPSR